MAALPDRPATTLLDPCSRTMQALAADLVACFTGVSVLFVGVVHDIPSRAMERARVEVNRAPSARLEPLQAAPEATEEMHLFTTAVVQPDRERDFSPDLASVNGPAPGIAPAYRQQQALATPAFCWDPREWLAMMAARQRGGGSTDWDGTGALVALATSDDDSAVAVVAPVSDGARPSESRDSPFAGHEVRDPCRRDGRGPRM